jgi:aminoglycoside phosphotransferase (APT) family kinase protein
MANRGSPVLSNEKVIPLIAAHNNDIQLVSRISSQFLADQQLRVVPLLRRGSVNKVFIVEATDTKVVVRLRNDSESVDEYTKEAWCINKVGERNVPVARVLDVGVIEDQPYIVQTYIEGDEGRDTLFPRSHIWRELGKYARVIHSIQVAGFGLKHSDLTQGDSRASWLEYVNYNIESLNDNDELLKLKVVTKQQSRTIKAIFEQLKEPSFDFGLNHSDLSLKNVIVDQSGKVNLLDWGSAEASIVPHHDVIQMLKMNMLENDPDDDDIQSFLEGYGISQPEFAQMLPTLESLLLLRAFDKLRWAIDWRIEGLESYIHHARSAVERKLY